MIAVDVNANLTVFFKIYSKFVKLYSKDDLSYWILIETGDTLLLMRPFTNSGGLISVLHGVMARTPNEYLW